MHNLFGGVLALFCLVIFTPGALFAADTKTDPEADTTTGGQAPSQYQELTWDDLMPEGWEPPYYELVDEFSDPVAHSAQAFQAQAPAPLVDSLEGKKMRLPGYVIPVKFDEQGVSEFLLVPYVGACIHVPPPPENQIVYVSLAKPLDSNDLWAPVWVNGTMSLAKAETQYATAGYQIKNARTEVYVFEGTY